MSALVGLRSGQERHARFMMEALVVAATLACTATPASAWSFTVGEEDWGETCYLSQQAAAGKGTLTLLKGAGKGKPIAVFIDGPRDPSAAAEATWTVDRNPQRRLAASMSDYFGSIELETGSVPAPVMLRELESGSVLKVIVEGSSFSFDLTGITRPLKAFGSC